MELPLPVYFYNPLLPPGFDPSDHKWFNYGPTVWSWPQHHYMGLEGIPSQLVKEMPRSGIVLAHTRVLPKHLIPSKDLFTICLPADHAENPWAKVEIMQNKATAIHSGGKKRYYVPLFPQVNLIPRPESRGDRFERIAFFGTHWNLDISLRSEEFMNWMRDQGLTFVYCTDSSQWNDYREIDAVLAVREFTPGNLRLDKPPSKLFNAWLAGVPAVVGPEAAYRSHRESDLDFLEVGTMEEVKAALLRLKEDAALRHAMRANGLRRGPEFTAERIGKLWAELMRGPIAEDVSEWRASLAGRTIFLMRRTAINAPVIVKDSAVASAEFARRIAGGVARRMPLRQRRQPE